MSYRPVYHQRDNRGYNRRPYDVRNTRQFSEAKRALANRIADYNLNLSREETEWFKKYYNNTVLTSAIGDLIKEKKIGFPFKKSHFKPEEQFTMFDRLRAYKPNVINTLSFEDFVTPFAKEHSKLIFYPEEKPVTLVFPDEDYNEIDVLIDYYQEQARMSASVRSCRSPLEEFFNHPYTFVKLVLDSNDTFNSINLREAIYHKQKECTIFKSTLARCLMTYIAKECKTTPQELRVLDFSAGWGDRLIGALSLPVRSYHAADPNKKLQKGHSEIISELGQYIANDWKGEGDISNAFKVEYVPFESLPLTDGSYDAVLTSPPYFNFENYASDETQSISMYPEYTDWLCNFLFVCILRIWKALRRGGVVALHLSSVSGADFCVEALLLFVKGWIKDSSYRGVIMAKGATGKCRPTWIWKKREAEETEEEKTLKRKRDFYENEAKEDDEAKKDDRGETLKRKKDDSTKSADEHYESQSNAEAVDSGECIKRKRISQEESAEGTENIPNDIAQPNKIQDSTDKQCIGMDADVKNSTVMPDSPQKLSPVVGTSNIPTSDISVSHEATKDEDSEASERSAARRSLAELLPDAWNILTSDDRFTEFLPRSERDAISKEKIEFEQRKSKRELPTFASRGNLITIGDVSSQNNKMPDSRVTIRKATINDKRAILNIGTCFNGVDYLNDSIDKDFENKAIHHFVAEVNGIVSAYARYHKSGNDYFVVQGLRTSELSRGKGLCQKLVHYMEETIREQNNVPTINIEKKAEDVADANKITTTNSTENHTLGKIEMPAECDASNKAMDINEAQKQNGQEGGFDSKTTTLPNTSPTTLQLAATCASGNKSALKVFANQGYTSCNYMKFMCIAEEKFYHFIKHIDKLDRVTEVTACAADEVVLRRSDLFPLGVVGTQWEPRPIRAGVCKELVDEFGVKIFVSSVHRDEASKPNKITGIAFQELSRRAKSVVLFSTIFTNDYYAFLSLVKNAGRTAEQHRLKSFYIFMPLSDAISEVFYAKALAERDPFAQKIHLAMYQLKTIPINDNQQN